MKLTLVRLLALSGLLVAGGAAAEGLALGTKAGTLGAGIETTYAMSDRFNLRFGVNSFSYDYEETASDIRYDAELDLGSGALLLDWHPFAGVFRVSLGYMRNENIVRVDAVSSEDGSFTPAQVASLSGDVTFKENVPYFGLGWGNAPGGRGPALSFEVGAMFQGSPEVTLRSSDNSIPENDLRREEQEAEDDLENFKIYPVISLGLSYHF